MKQCRFCFLTYDDAYKYTSCPHMPIGAGPAPFHPVTNPGGYCKEHDLFAHIRLPNGEPFPKEEKMPTDKPPESAFVPAYDRIEGRPSHGCGGVQPFPGRAVNVIEGERKGMAGIEGEETPLHQDFYRPKTLGIPPATEGPLQVLQFARSATPPVEYGKVHEAALALARCPLETDLNQRSWHESVEYALAYFLTEIVANAPAGSERSTAISRAREAAMWAHEAINHPPAPKV